MNVFDASIDQLSQKFDVVGLIELDNFYSPNGEKWLYEQLSKLHKTAYHNNERILLVQRQGDVYDYQDMPGRVVTQVQKFLSIIDISNYFVILITSNNDAKYELEQVKTLYSTDDNAITCCAVTAEYHPKFVEGDTFCILPWLHLYIGPDGNVLPCCLADNRYPLSNIKTQSLVNIFSTEEFTKLRGNMLTGVRSKHCHTCYANEESNLPSARQSWNRKWSQHIPTNLSAEHPLDLVYLDIRINNFCNLKCRMCSSYYSSSIAQEDIELFNKYTNQQAPDSAIRSQAVDDLAKFLPHVEHIYFAGGEPLMLPEHYTMLEELIKCKNTSVDIRYNTNFTTTKFKKISVFDLWNQFSNVTVGASIDAAGTKAEYIRHGCVWSDILNNIEKLKTQSPHVDLKVTSTVGFMNVESLLSMQQDWHNSGLLDISKFSLVTMTDPKYYSVRALPKHHKQRLESVIIDHLNWCKDITGSAVVIKQWKNVLSYMNSEDDSHLLSEFRRLTMLLDQHRNRSFKDTFPEFADLL